MTPDSPEPDQDSEQLTALDAYDLVDKLPRGPARAAAWNAYALQIYSDKLAGAARSFDEDTAEIAGSLLALAGLWVDRAVRLTADPAAPLPEQLSNDSLPHWHTPTRTEEQLAGMREAVEALHTYVAFDLESGQVEAAVLPALRDQLAAVDKRLETVELLWIPHPPPAIRDGIGDALSDGLDGMYTLGQRVANPSSPDDER